MRDIDLFQAALGLATPWFVSSSAFDAASKRLEISIDFRPGGRFSCPDCGAAECPVHDVKQKSWRHLNFFQHETVLNARVPRVSCGSCGIKQVALPWAREQSGFTLLFEAFILAMAKAMPVRDVARLVGEHDTRLWRVLEHYVSQAVEKQDLSEVRQIAVDETSARRGHDYVTLFADLARRKVIYVAEGRDAATVAGFAGFLEKHGGKKESITDVSIDMSAAFISGVKSNLPNAKITFDKFHVIKLVNGAVDEVRRQERHANPLLKGTRYLWLKNVETLSDAEKSSLAGLEGANLDTVQAWQMRLNLQDVFKAASPAGAARFLKRWHAWVKISELKPMIKAANTIMSRSSEILRAITSKLSNGLLEAINGNVQAAKRKAKGFRTKRNLKTIIYLIAGDLLDPVPT